MKREHPEKEDDEVFIGNFCSGDLRRIGWKTKRIGDVAYSASGDIVANYYPVFVKREEYLKKYYTDTDWQKLCPELESRV